MISPELRPLPDAGDYARPGPRLRTDPQRVAAGRSGNLVNAEDVDGRATSRKVFETSEPARVGQYLILGAANPYSWNESAVQAALLRRRILAPLVRAWFGGRLRVPAALAHDWDSERQSFELITERVNGRAANLPHPLRQDAPDEARELRKEILPRLRDKLREVGFDGLLWQAGPGNPLALNRFVLEVQEGERRWVWIDLETAMPALLSPSPGALFGTYLPLTWKHRRPLFDDVDTERLAGWIHAHAERLEGLFGPGSVQRLDTDVSALAQHQETWKRMTRRQSAVAARLSEGRISPARASWYLAHPVRWSLSEAGRAARFVARAAANRGTRLFVRIGERRWSRVPGGVMAFLASQTCRERHARNEVRGIIADWRARGQLSAPHAERLSELIDREVPSTHLADFGVHLALVPCVRALVWIIAPLLLLQGVIGWPVLALAYLFGGAAARTLYTANRCIADTIRRRRAPWLALAIGALPIAGRLAHPTQLARSRGNENALLGNFLVHDCCARLGNRLPIWGGADTWTEHLAARLARPLVRIDREPPVTSSLSAPGPVPF